ncbi:MAG: tetratricopeptide repeat protein, partial [Deltaproteobacteria bacterium]|nr:tetratricopeptide repeat protein [Deltaproteobacteria bacterium]
MRYIICFGVGCLVFLLSCTPTTVSQLTPEEEQIAARQFSQAEQQLKLGKIDLAYQSFESIFTKYPRAKVADNALLRAAQIKANQKQYPQSIEFLQQLLHTYPSSDIKDQALRDQAFVYALQNDCPKMMDAVFHLELASLSSKDQAKISSRVQHCMQQDANSLFQLIWNLKQYQRMNPSNPLYQTTQTKIIENIAMQEDERFLINLVKKYAKQFPAGYAS